MTSTTLYHRIIHKYLSQGFALLPVNGMAESGCCTCRNPQCSSPGKHPVGSLAPQGLKNASADVATVDRWFSGASHLNVGIATGKISNVVVLDIDPRHGGDQSLALLEKEHGALPKTLWWKTGGGGRHILFAYPKDGLPLPNSISKIGHGIDVRGDGGFIVAPPSRHASGGSYSFPNKDILKTPLAEIPRWLLVAMRKDSLVLPSRTSGCQSAQALVSGKVIEGQRNMTIARLAGVLLSRKVPTKFCHELLLAFNDARCTPPLSSNEVASVINSIGRRAFAQMLSQNPNKWSRK
jgi:putative DNA primase/helicase